MESNGVNEEGGGDQTATVAQPSAEQATAKDAGGNTTDPTMVTRGKGNPSSYFTDLCF